MTDVLRLTTFQDVVDVILPICSSMTERDVADLIQTVHLYPESGPEILDAYKAANYTVPTSVWTSVWYVITTAANVAGIITTIAGAVELVP